jgi:hypothetical protein
MILTLGAFNIQASTYAHTVGYCITSRKVAGSIPDVAILFFSLTFSFFWPNYGPEVDSDSN